MCPVRSVPNATKFARSTKMIEIGNARGIQITVMHAKAFKIEAQNIKRRKAAPKNCCIAIT
jgi:hypothetical protein